MKLIGMFLVAGMLLLAGCTAADKDYIREHVVQGHVTARTHVAANADAHRTVQSASGTAAQLFE